MGKNLVLMGEDPNPIRKRMMQIKADADASLKRMDSLLAEIDRSLEAIESRLPRPKVRKPRTRPGRAAPSDVAIAVEA